MISFISSAVSLKDYPLSEQEVVFVGRSNVGKSSLINALYGQIAYVGKTPGKTKLLNFFDIDNKYTVCDVPGYGYAKLSDDEIIQFGEMMEEYFLQRKIIKLCVMILDVRRIPNEDDLSMLEYLRYYDIPFVVVLNKVDKLTNNQIANNVKTISQALEINEDSLLKISATSKINIDNLNNLILSFIK